MPFYLGRKAIRKVPVVEAQENIRYDQLAALARHCRVADESDSREAAADKFILALKALLDRCGLEKGCPPLAEQDYDRLTAMIDADSINYSPSPAPSPTARSACSWTRYEGGIDHTTKSPSWELTTWKICSSSPVRALR